MMTNYEVLEKIEILTDEELKRGKIVLDVAGKILEEQHPSGDFDIIRELLENRLQYNYNDYSYYLEEMEDVIYCDEALLISKAYDIINIAEDLKRILE